MAAPLLYRRAYPLINLMVLLGLLLLLCQPLLWDIELPTTFWVKQAIMFGFWVALYFLNAYVLVPRFLFRNRIKWFAAALFTAVLCALLLDLGISYTLKLQQLIFKAFNPEGTPPTGFRFDINPVLLLATLLVLGISTTIKVVQKWQKDTVIRQTLEKQKISTELSFLKAQINPHFFFNTLHSIYALTHMDVETAREALYTLSRMMRYVLYETQSGNTLLSKEIEFLEDYIKLMQLRLTEKVQVAFEKPQSFQDVRIAPMLFLPFVENAFKHGVSAIHASSIRIVIFQNEQSLKLEVCNTLLPEKRVVLEDSSGIGLVNTRRRLDLLYADKYHLLINERSPKNEYQVYLTLDLS
ncbi:sensor histidine kinase [Cesiribacter sp. SM1]|uniref:sensor histidine kinase n=1 Tax=Cesiribacter sp. SM1 TaxID=2861196 RepID=UPI001CD4EADE|nr:histidine kinase [Cesiribacter sp. SM1]